PGEDLDADAPLVAALLAEGAHLVGHSSAAVAAMLAASMCPGVVLSLTLCQPVAFPARPPLRRRPADGPRHRRTPAATRRRPTTVARLSRDRRPRCRGSRPAAAPAGARSTGDPRGPPPSVGRRTPGRLARGGTIPQTGDRRRSQRPRQPARPPGPLL